jgi:hypothetical protein
MVFAIMYYWAQGRRCRFILKDTSLNSLKVRRWILMPYRDLQCRTAGSNLGSRMMDQIFLWGIVISRPTAAMQRQHVVLSRSSPLFRGHLSNCACGCDAVKRWSRGNSARGLKKKSEAVVAQPGQDIFETYHIEALRC